MLKTVGTRLRKAREEAGFSRGVLAKALGLTPDYIALLEAGKRAPSFATLTRLAAYLNRDVGAFFRDAQPAFDALLAVEGLDEKIRAEFRKFRRFAESYLELEALTNRRPELAPLYTNISAERLADEERRRLGLGTEPVRDAFGLFEANGLRLLRQALPEESKVAGVFVFLEERNAAFGLVNSFAAPGHQAFIAAHLYAHYLKDRLEGPIVDAADVVVDEYVSLYPPRERFAQTFASRFLMPPAKVAEIIEKDVRTPGLRYEDVLYLKRYFGVSAAAMLRTLRRSGLLARPSFEEFFHRDAEGRERQVFGPSAGAGGLAPKARLRIGRPRPVFSDRYRLLEAEAAATKRRSG